MNILARLHRRSLDRGTPALWLGFLILAGCGREEIRVYQIPREREGEPAWQLPTGWVEREPGSMRVARFSVPNTNGEPADVSIIPLRDISASRADIVNMWREQIRLAPVQEPALDAMSEKVPLGAISGELFDMVSEQSLLEGGTKARTLVAMARVGKTSWFVKMAGADDLVRGQKPAFLGFLKSLNLDAIKPAPTTSAHQGEPPASSAAAVKPEWKLPDGWQEVPAPRILVAKFRIAAADGATADVNVSVEADDGGGLLNNVNRWRTQLGLEPVEDTALAKLVTSLELPDGKASLVDFNGTDARTGQPARIIGAIVPREQQGQTWFYKMMGNAQVAGQEKAAFIKFFQTVKYPNG